MRLGGPLLQDGLDPDAWVGALRKLGYSAAYCPVGPEAADDAIEAYVKAAADADIVIAEVGAWSSPLSPDETKRREALDKCRRALALAEKIGARCCVNVAGSCGPDWAGPHPYDLTEATFEAIVETVRGIIDAVKPTRTYYTLEAMPWMYPDSPDCYARMIEAIDREAFAVHLDPANLICSPHRYFRSGELIRESFAKLGPYVRSCHGKDVTLWGKAMVHLDEVRPGLGGMDYRAFLRELDKLDPDTPLMLEHLSKPEEYAAAAEYVRSVAAEVSVSIR